LYNKNEHEASFDLTKKDDDRASGSAMAMFDVEA
jgi:hypothetical protein